MDEKRTPNKNSLRTVCWKLLYLNLLGNVFALILRISDSDDVTYKQFLQDSFSKSLDIVLDLIGGFIFVVGIGFLTCCDPPHGLIKAPVIFLLFDVFYMLYGVFRIFSGEGIRENYRMLEENASRKKSYYYEQEAYVRSKESAYPFTIVFMFILLLGCLAFKLYSISTFLRYKFELKRKQGQRGTTALRNETCVGVTPSTASSGDVHHTAPHSPLSPQHLNQCLNTPLSSPQHPHYSPSPPQHLNQRHNIPLSPPQQPSSLPSINFPYDSSKVPLTLPNRSPSHPPQFPYQSPSIPLNFSSQSASQSVRFPHNSSNVPLILPNQSPSKPSEFPYHSSRVLLDLPSQSASQAQFPYNSTNIPLSLPQK